MIDGASSSEEVLFNGKDVLENVDDDTGLGRSFISSLAGRS